MLFAGTRKDVQLGHVTIRNAAGFPQEYRLQFTPGSLNVVSPPGEVSTMVLAALLRAVLRPESLDDVANRYQTGDRPLSIEASLATADGPLEIDLGEGAMRLRVAGETVYEGTDSAVLRSALENTLGRLALEVAAELYRHPTEVLFSMPDEPPADRPPAVQALVQSRDELHRIQEHLAQLLAQNSAREQRTTLQQKRRKTQGSLNVVRKYENRVAELQQRIEGEFAHLVGQSERLQSDLHYLSLAEKDLHKAEEALQGTLDRADQLDKQFLQLKARVDERFPQFVGLDADYPRWQRRFHDLRAILAARRSECERLEQELSGLRERLQSTYERFTNATEDFEVKLGAFSAIRDETTQWLSRLDEEMEAVAELERERGGINQQLATMPHFLGCTDDFPDRLRELLSLRQELGDRQKTVSGLTERRNALKKRLDENGNQHSRPLDFPEKLHYLRTQQHEWKRQLRELEDQELEQQELSLQADELQKRLKVFEDLPENGEAFLDKMNALINAQQELESTAASVGDVEERLHTLDTAITSQYAAFANASENYLDVVEEVRTTVAGLRTRQAEIAALLSRREALSSQLAAAEARLADNFGDLEAAPADFPGKLQEYFRLQGVHQRLLGESEALQNRVRPLEERLERDFAPFAHLTRYRFRLRRLRAHDELLRNLLHHLEWEARERRELEVRLAGLKTELAGVEDLPEVDDDREFVHLCQSRGAGRELAERKTVQRELASHLEEHRKNLQELATTLGYADVDYAVQLEGSSERLERLEHLKIAQMEWRGAERVSESLAEWVSNARQELESFDNQQKAAKNKILSPDDAARLSVQRAELDTIKSELEEAERHMTSLRSKGGKFFGGNKGETGAEQAAHVAVLKAAVERGQSRLSALLKQHGLTEKDVKAALQKVEEFHASAEKRSGLVSRLETCQLLLVLSNTDAEQRRETFAEEARLLGLDTADDAADRLMVHIREFIFRRDSLAQLMSQKKTVDAQVEELSKVSDEPQDTPHADVERLLAARRKRQEATSLTSRLSLLRPFDEIERVRGLLVQQVAASLEEIGLEKSLVDSEDRAKNYLEYQQVLAELEDLKGQQDQLLNRSGSGNDLERIEQKLTQLRRVLPADALQAPVEASLQRHREYTEMRDTVVRLARDLAEMAGLDSLKGEQARLDSRIKAELARVQLDDEGAVAERVSLYHGFRTLEAEKRGLENILKRRLHAEVRPDGTTETDLDRLRTTVVSLKESIGAWADLVRNSDDLEAVSRRLREARDVGADLSQVRKRLSDIPSASSLEQRIEQLHGMTKSSCAELGVPESPEKDDELLRSWRNGVNLEDELRSVEEQRSWELQEKPGDGGGTDTIVDRLQRRIFGLESQVAKFHTVTDAEPVLKEFREYQQLCQQRDRCVRQLGEHRSPEVLRESRQSATNRLQAKANELGLPTVDCDTSLVLEEYRASLQLRAEIRTLEGMLHNLTGADDGDEKSLESLQHEADALESQLGERAKVMDTDAEISMFADYQKELEAANKVRDQRDAVLGGSQKRAVRQAEDLVREAQERIGSWIQGRDAQQVLVELETYQELENELAELEAQGGAMTESSKIQAELESIEKAMADLPAVDDSLNLLPAIAECRLREAQTRTRVAECEEAVENAGLATPDDPALACAARASHFLKRLTLGQYTELLTGTGNGAQVSAADGKKVGLQQLSVGVREMAGVSWQLALLEEMGPGGPLPLVVEDPATADSATCQELATLLQEIARDRQVVLVTPPAEADDRGAKGKDKQKGAKR